MPPATVMSRARRSALERRWLSVIGVLSATVVAVCSNVLLTRFYTRFDLTSAQLYSLSPPTLETLEGLSERVDVVVFLGGSDPELGAIRRLLTQYEAASRMVKVRYVDPDRDPATFVALRNRYRLTEGRAEQGQLVSDAALIVARGDARWIVTEDDLLSYDAEEDSVQPRLELALTEGFRQVLYPQSRRVCFTEGHGEPSLADGGPRGLAALRHVLEKNNYEVVRVAPAEAGSGLELERCDLVVVAAPAQALGAAAATRLAQAVRRGTSVLVVVAARLGDDQRVLATGLEPVLDPFGVAVDPILVFERDPDAALPTGIGGEVFLAVPARHEITRGMTQGQDPRHRVLLQLSVAWKSGESVHPLLSTSDQAFGVQSGAVLTDPDKKVSDVERDRDGPFQVAVASELDTPPGASKRGARLVAIGSASPLLGLTWQDPALVATRRFVESAVAWLTERPALVHLPEKPARQVGMHLTEAALTELARYVLMYMPLTALALGGLVLYRRRWTPRASRESQESST